MTKRVWSASGHTALVRPSLQCKVRATVEDDALDQDEEFSDLFRTRHVRRLTGVCELVQAKRPAVLEDEQLYHKCRQCEP